MLLWVALFPTDARAATSSQKEDERMEREKVMRAADQLEIIMPEIEKARLSLQHMEAQLSQLQSENETIKKTVADLQKSREKEREAILDEVSKIIAESSEKQRDAMEKAIQRKSAESEKKSDKNDAATKTTKSAPAKTDAKQDAAPAEQKQKGYEHVVEKGQTLSMIAKAYQDQGVKVTVPEIMKANKLKSETKLSVGQKLFIPKKEK